MRSVSTQASQRALLDAIEATARGEANGFEKLYRLTSAKLFGICLRICRNRDGAEDALNEVYLSVWRRANRFERGRAQPMSWLCTIARNRSIDWVRSNGRPTESDAQLADLPSEDADAQTLAEQSEDSRRLHLCLDRLDAQQREAIRTAFFEGVTYSELAERKKVPLGTMKTWIRRGLLKLKDCLNGD